MSLVQWNPFREMDDLLARVQRNVSQSIAARTGNDAWAPAVNISETAKEYLVKVELPGVTKEQVKVEVQNGILTLAGERKFDHEDKDERHHRVELAFGAYSRSFVLPDDVLEEKISADYKDGILTVRLPKTDIKNGGTKQIKVL